MALRPFDPVIVTAIHAFFGLLFDAPIGYGKLAETIVIATAGNFVGEIGLVTFTHVA
ncbi:hypothetical protein ACFQMM_04575 [Saliphagus sp. GCM10025308]